MAPARPNQPQTRDPLVPFKTFLPSQVATDHGFRRSPGSTESKHHEAPDYACLAAGELTSDCRSSVLNASALTHETPRVPGSDLIEKSLLGLRIKILALRGLTKQAIQTRDRAWPTRTESFC